jgi:hypothetical protein
MKFVNRSLHSFFFKFITIYFSTKLGGSWKWEQFY